MFGGLADYTRFAEGLLTEPAETQLSVCRHLAQHDLFFLLWFVCGRKDLYKPFFLERCRDVQQSPDGHLDLWSREHGKSSIISFGKTVQDILCDPEVTVGIFSHTRPNAKGFLRQIMREFELNELLKTLFPEVLWANPRKEAPKWSEDDGIIVKRKGNPKEATVEAWGLVDGMPTGKHFSLRVYDDVVTKESVTTPEQIRKTTEAWELSDNLGMIGGKVRTIGTRYHLADTYATMIERKAVIPRIFPATDNGLIDGNPVLFTQEEWQRRLRTQSPATVSAQLLQHPQADGSAIFKEEWFELWPDGRPLPPFAYIVQSWDTAYTEKTANDPTACTTWGVFNDKGVFAVILLDAWDEHMDFPDMRERAIKESQYRYGSNEKRIDVILIEEKGSGISLIQELRLARLPIITYNPGKASKEQRAHAVSPLVQAGLVYVPESETRKGKPKTWAMPFIQQVTTFPYAKNDDYVDTFTQALKLIRDQDFLTLESAPEEEELTDDEPADNPYAA